MKKKLKELVAEKRAVSPVIGVVLMVAVVVILAAVIGAFVLGLGGSQQETPQVAFTYEDGTLTMSSGDPIPSGSLYVAIDGEGRTTWTGSTSGTDGAVVAGDSQEITGATDSIKVIYDDGKGNTAVLTTIDLGNAGGGNGAGG